VGRGVDRGAVEEPEDAEVGGRAEGVRELCDVEGVRADVELDAEGVRVDDELDAEGVVERGAVDWRVGSGVRGAGAGAAAT
jgi:hypothetical protein